MASLCAPFAGRRSPRAARFRFALRAVCHLDNIALNRRNRAEPGRNRGKLQEKCKFVSRSRAEPEEEPGIFREASSEMVDFMCRTLL